MPLTQDVLDRLLVAKGLLGPIRFAQTPRPDRISLARQILAAHDAAELALAAVARHLGSLPQSSQTYLMDYFPAIQQARPTQDVPGRDYFGQLNRVRVALKHHGIFPDPQQWYRTGESVWGYVSRWCQDYLEMSLDDLDESALIIDADVKLRYDDAVQAFRREDYKGALELLAFATEALFNSNRALRNLVVGLPRAEDAIKLAAFGVHANDYLALQEFLPGLRYEPDRDLVVKWEQGKYGHSANWTRNAVEFCLRTFVGVALRIQDAEWIPGAIDFWRVYEHRITAVTDNVEIVQEQRPPFTSGFYTRVVVRTLHKGESLRAQVRPDEPSGLVAALLGKEQRPMLSIVNFDENIFGKVEADKVEVKCVPRDNPRVRRYFPDLPEIDFNPQGGADR